MTHTRENGGMTTAGMERDETAKRLKELEEQRDSLRDALRARVEDTDRLRGERDKYWELAEKATAPAPLTVEALEGAFYSGRVSPTCKAGDVVITRERDGWYTIVERRAGGDLSIGYQRILASAPEPEPWADLADALRAHTDEPDPDETARMLYENGVRMAGGGE